MTYLQMESTLRRIRDTLREQGHGEEATQADDLMTDIHNLAANSGEYVTAMFDGEL